MHVSHVVCCHRFNYTKTNHDIVTSTDPRHTALSTQMDAWRKGIACTHSVVLAKLVLEDLKPFLVSRWDVHDTRHSVLNTFYQRIVVVFVVNEPCGGRCTALVLLIAVKARRRTRKTTTCQLDEPIRLLHTMNTCTHTKKKNYKKRVPLQPHRVLFDTR